MPRTLIQIQEELAIWEACLIAISQGQEYRIDGRWLTRADLATAHKIVKELRREEAALERGTSMRVSRVVPI